MPGEKCVRLTVTGRDGRGNNYSLVLHATRDISSNASDYSAVNTGVPPCNGLIRESGGKKCHSLIAPTAFRCAGAPLSHCWALGGWPRYECPFKHPY